MTVSPLPGSGKAQAARGGTVQQLGVGRISDTDTDQQRWVYKTKEHADIKLGDTVLCFFQCAQNGDIVGMWWYTHRYVHYIYVHIYIYIRIYIYTYIYIYTRKTAVFPSPKLSFVTFKFCSSCRRNAFFSFIKRKKMHFDLRPPMNLSTSILRGRCSVFWSYLHFRWQARDFLRFWHVLDVFFFELFVALLPFFGGGGGGGMITSFRSRTLFGFYVNTSVMLRAWLSWVLLTRQWCYALDFLRFMLPRQWCYALDFLRCDVNTSVIRKLKTDLVASSKHRGDRTLLGETLRKKNMKKNQVLAAASLHRQPGLKAILNAMTVYRKDCWAGIIKLSPSDAFKVAKLHWMSWNTRKKSSRVVRWRFATFFHWKFPEIMTKTPSFKQFQPTARQRFCAYIYIYIYRHTHNGMWCIGM